MCMCAVQLPKTDEMLTVAAADSLLMCQWNFTLLPFCIHCLCAAPASLSAVPQ